MQSLRWLAMIMGMLFGYSLAGPIGGLIGLAGGWWLARRNVLRSPPPPPPQRPTPPASGSKLDEAYRELGVSADASMEAVRKAYRRRLNRTHPDKLAATGADKTALDEAAQRTHDLRQAYDRIRKSRARKT